MSDPAGPSEPRNREGRGGTPWTIRLSPAAVRALVGLPRQDRELVGQRIRHLETGGLPGSADPGQLVTVPAGALTLICIRGREDGAIVVVTLRPTREGVVALSMRRAQSVIRRMGGEGMGQIARDIRFALRSLMRAPTFAGAAILTLALGIGASSAIFSVIDAVLLRPLPYGNPHEVVTVWSRWVDFPKTWVSVPEFQVYSQQNRTLSGLALYQRGSANFTDPDDPERVAAAAVTHDLFRVLQVEALVGRTFTLEDARDSLDVVVLGHEVWQRRFGADPGVVGSDVELNGTPQTVVGVAPEGFALPLDLGSSGRVAGTVADVYVPIWVDVETPAQVPQNGGSHGSYVTGRLLPGTTVEEARRDLSRIVDRLRVEQQTYPPERGFEPLVFAVMDDVLGTARTALYVLAGAVLLVLLIACANVANLLLARSEVRETEVALRSALGAARSRIIVQLATESLVLGALGGGLGLLIAWAGVDALLAIDPESVPRGGAVTVDARLIAFAFGLSLLTALVFGLAPALRSLGVDLRGALTSGTRASRTVGGRAFQRLLVGGQCAIAVVLLVGSSLMIRTFAHLQRIDPGFEPDRVLTMRVNLPAATYPTIVEVRQFFAEALRRVREIPGVVDAAAVRSLPLQGQIGDSGFRPAHYQPGPNENPAGDWQFVSPRYFEVMGIPLLAGRTFGDGDDETGANAIVINEAMARRYWGDLDPIGTTARSLGQDGTVVGVVADLTHNGLTADIKQKFYRPLSQVPGGWAGAARGMTFTIKTASGPRGLADQVRREIRSLDPSLPVAEVQTMEDLLRQNVAQPRFVMTLLAVFSALATFLAIIGVYGVLSYGVTRETRDIGVRIALGADGGRVVRGVVGRGLSIAVVGILLGTAGAAGVTRLLQGILVGVRPLDPPTFLAVPVLFIGVALLASYVPARRAARVNPLEALRAE